MSEKPPVAKKKVGKASKKNLELRAQELQNHENLAKRLLLNH